MSKAFSNARTLMLQVSCGLAAAFLLAGCINTRNGVPTAQIVPLDDQAVEPTVQSLIAQGRLLAPRSTRPPRAPKPLALPGSRSLSEVVLEERDG